MEKRQKNENRGANIQHVSWHSICEARSNVEWKYGSVVINREPLTREPLTWSGLSCVAAGEEGSDGRRWIF